MIMDNVIAFPGKPKSDANHDQDRRLGCGGRPYRRKGPNMQTFVFRSRALILASTPAELVRDVCCDIPKAKTKLRTMQEHLKTVTEMAAAEIRELSTASKKLDNAVKIAVLMTGGGS
jgi:hypothetical protein